VINDSWFMIKGEWQRKEKKRGRAIEKEREMERNRNKGSHEESNLGLGNQNLVCCHYNMRLIVNFEFEYDSNFVLRFHLLINRWIRVTQIWNGLLLIWYDIAYVFGLALLVCHCLSLFVIVRHCCYDFHRHPDTSLWLNILVRAAEYLRIWVFEYWSI
jgi:apolipoprotein N-acyltransferase